MERTNQDSKPGERTNDNRIISTIESLMNGKNNQKIIENLKLYYDAGRGCRIAVFHENIENSEKQIWMLDSVYQKMKDLIDHTATNKREYPFLIFGWSQGDTYLINNLQSGLDISDEWKETFYGANPKLRAKDAAVDFNVLLRGYGNYINSFLDRKMESGQKPLIGLGHTHPNLSGSYGYYSLPDLVNYTQYEDFFRGNREDGSFEHCHIVLPENGDVDCITYNKDKKRFQKIIGVKAVGHTEDDDIDVPAYTFKPERNPLEVSYVKEDEESKDDELYAKSVKEIIERHKWDNVAE